MVSPGKQLDLIERALALLNHFGCRLKLCLYLRGGMIQLNEGHVTHVIGVGLILRERPLRFEMPRVPVGISDRLQIVFDQFEAPICFPSASCKALLESICDALLPRMVVVQNLL